MLLLIAYPALMTTALWTGLVERLVASEDLKVEIQNPAYSIWPGKVRMKNVRIYMNGTTQFILEGHDLVINLTLWELFKRRIHVTELAARDVIYQMRVQMKDTQGVKRRVAAYPPLEGLPGANVVKAPVAAKTEKRDPDWTVRVQGMDIGVKELWFFEYRYLGKGHLRGGFLVGPNQMEVTTAVQDLGPGELRFGHDEIVATGLQGQISANIPKLNPNEHADASFMELVSARVNLRSQIESLSSVGAYFEDAGVEVTKGKGPLAFDLYMDAGKLGNKSHLSFQTDALNVKGNGFGAGTDWQLDFDARGSKDGFPIIRSTSKSTYFSLARGMRAFTVQVHGHHEEAELDTIRLSRATDLKSASVRMPQIVSVDLRDLPAVLAPDGPLKVKKGELHGALSLDMDKDYWAQGPLSATVKGLELEAADIHVGGQLKLESQVRFNPKRKVNMIQGMLLTARDMSMHTGSRDVEGWWMNLSSRRLTLWNGEPSAFDGTVSVRARDMDPVLKALAAKDVISELIPFFTSLNDFRAATTIRATGPMLDVTLASESQVWDAAGRFYKNGKKSEMAIVFGGQAVSLGVASKDDDLELVPFAKTAWLNERLQSFPKPLVQFNPDKP